MSEEGNVAVTTMDVVVLGVLGFVVAVFGLVLCKNRKLRGSVIEFIVGDQERNASFGKYNKI